jgi:hypothetical protein
MARLPSGNEKAATTGPSRTTLQHSQRMLQPISNEHYGVSYIYVEDLVSRREAGILQAARSNKRLPGCSTRGETPRRKVFDVHFNEQTGEKIFMSGSLCDDGKLVHTRPHTATKVAGLQQSSADFQAQAFVGSQRGADGTS